jgi:hypothetical protein
VRELLGDQRQRGLGAHTELRLVDGELQLGVRPDGPEIRGSEVTVARFRTLRREPASLQRRLRDRWGWEIGLGTAWRRGASVTGRTTFDLGFLGMLGATSGLERFTVVGLGAALDADATKLWPSTFTAGPRVSLLHRSHLGGRFANALHLEAAYLPRFDVIGDDLGRLSQRASVRMGIDLHFGSRQRGVLVGPALSGGWEAAGGRTETRFLGVLGVELL